MKNVVLFFVAFALGFIFYPGVIELSKWYNSPPPPPSDLVNAITESMNDESQWKLANNCQGIINEEKGLLINLDYTFNSDKVRTVERDNAGTKICKYFNRHDINYIVDASKELYQKLLIKSFTKK